MQAKVLLEIKAKNIDKTFTYLVPKEYEESIKIGIRVLVPFNNRNLEGFVLELGKDEKLEYELKPITSLIDEEPVLNGEMLELGKVISKRTFCNLITVYQSMLPKALKAKNNYNLNKKYIIYVVVNEVNCSLTKKQKELYGFINKNKKVLKKEALNISISAYKTLLAKGVIKEESEETYRLDNKNTEEDKNVILNDEQKQVINEVVNKIDEHNTFLLFGVTGSGKTEVYMNIIKEVLKNNKEALVLVPEISLTPQLINTFRSRFDCGIAILHSHLSDGERYDEYRRILKNEVKIVIGARSSVFAPLTNLGVIIVDEENSPTYKQENNPMYNAIDVAIYRAKKYNIPVILGSATPSIESYTKAKIGQYKLLTLPNKINKSTTKVVIVDMKKSIKEGNKIFSKELKQKIEEKLKINEQVILLLNRRGYSTIINCKCGYVEKCPNCDIPLVYHKTSNNLRCHYCGYSKQLITKCPECGSEEIMDFGIGTEKLEELVNKTFEDAKVVRMDIDSTSKKNGHSEIIKDFKDKKYNILIGTQMVAKGLDFEDVTLVGVINGDASLNIPDFRSSERTFSLLSQVVGRAGRSVKKGEAIIQTFNTDHYSIINASKSDYVSFYNEEIEIRKKLNYPPFYSLALIKIRGEDYNLVSLEANKIKKYLTSNLKNQILGPTPGSVLKVNNVYYLQIIIKYKKIVEIYKELDYIYNKYKISDVRVDIDLNPIKI